MCKVAGETVHRGLCNDKVQLGVLHLCSADKPEVTGCSERTAGPISTKVGGGIDGSPIRSSTKLEGNRPGRGSAITMLVRQVQLMQLASS